MIGNRPDRLAFDAAKEIVAARMSNAQHNVSKENGKYVGEYFQAIYEKLLEIATSNDDE